MRSNAAAVALATALLWAGSCTPLEPESDSFTAAGSSGQSSVAGSPASGASTNGGAPNPGNGGSNDAGMAESSGSGGQDAAAGAGPSDECPPLEQREIKVLGEAAELTIDTDTAWTCQYDYRLSHNVVVAPGATLMIMPGTRVLLDKKVLLLSQRGAKLRAEGTAQAPILFTSSAAIGQRAPGDHRGVILIGDAPSHATTVPVYGSLSDSRAHFGGGPGGDAGGSCGALRYVRIEFGGGSIDDQALPGAALTLAGCGSATQVDHVQVHRATDGIGLLGGTVGLRHVLVTNNLLGQAIEWTGGYTGTMQFVVAQSLAASAAMQGSNSADDPETSPVSRPTIYNATLVGSAPLVTGQHFGFVLQLGARAVLKNTVILGFADAAFDLRLEPAVLQSQLGPGKAVDISHTLMHGNAAAYSSSSQALSGMESMRMQDPGLAAAANPTAEMPETLPQFAPLDATVNTQPAAVPNGFDATAGYRGGVPQDGVDWTQGWTDYPND